MPSQLDYQNASDHQRDRADGRTMLITRAIAITFAAFLLITAVFFVYANYAETLAVKRFFWGSEDWEVVEVFGYEDFPGYDVTGVLLAVKGRADATVSLYFDHTTSLTNNDEIRIVRMRGLEISDLQRQIRDDLRFSVQQRSDLWNHNGSIDVKDAGRFGNLFPHPIRDLKDLRTHYDEVYTTLRQLGDASAAQPAGPADSTK